MIIVTANARSATYTSNDLITSGSIGIPVAFNLSDDFAGLSNVAVFEGSGVSVDVLIVNNACVVPHEVLASAGGYLRVGIYGRNAGGTIAIPTVWAGTMPILQGVEPSDIDPAAPTPDWTAQVQAAAVRAVELAQSVVDAAERGDFDGVSPTVTVTDISGGHRVTVTDADGTRSFAVLDGTDGEDGRGIASAVLNADYTLTLTYTDGTSYTTPSLRGEPGENGISPVASVSKTGKVVTISITDKNGTTTASVSDGTDGAPGVGVPTGGTDGQMLVKDGSTDYSTKWANQPSVPVQDVQIDGTSVVTDGVANVPVASTSGLGVVGINVNGGIIKDSTTNKLLISKATTAILKAGTNVYFPVVAYNQHESAFYGLATAAGDSTQSVSSNAVGTYTDEALVKIQKMLGVYQRGELIADVTTTENVTEILVNTDLTGQPFELIKLVAIFSAGQSTTGTRDSFYGSSTGVDVNGTNRNFSFPSMIYPSATSEMYARIVLEAEPGLPVNTDVVCAVGDGSSQTRYSMVKPNIMNSITSIKIYQSGPTKSLIPAGANLKVYGIRAY